MWEDPIVAEIRRIREEISTRYNHDIAAICRAAREREATGDWETVSLPPRPVTRPGSLGMLGIRQNPHPLTR